MKYFGFLLFLALYSCRGSEKQNRAAGNTDSFVKKKAAEQSHPAPPEGNYSNPELVAAIYQQVLGIDQKKISDSIYLENEDFMEEMTDGGGALTGYFENGSLVKIKEWIGLSKGVIQNSYYFDGDELIYVSEREDNFYLDSNGIDHSRFGQLYLGSFFFRDNQLVDMVTLGYNRFDAENPALDPQKELLGAAADRRKMILRHRRQK